MGTLNIDITIGGNTANVRFICDDHPSQIAEYYVGWADFTADFFAALTDSQIEEMAERQMKGEYVGKFKSNRIFFLLYQPNANPQITLTSSGISMPQDLSADNTCPHDDVVIGGKSFKVFGIRFYRPEATDSITIKF